jgi:hypothetical protein
MPTAHKASKPSKKQVRHEIAVKLEKALASFKTEMGEKKFKSRIKKASKLFSEHYAKPASKKSATPSTKVAATKNAVKKAAPRKKAAEPVKP